ncbi:MAG: hypothetical protein ACTSPS_13000 [Promethearchaeota archaeon]
MFTKNISIEIKKGAKTPLKETYLVFYKEKNKIDIVQKFIDESKNNSITINLNECKRLINLFDFYLFNGEYESYKDEMLVFEKD